MDMREIRFGIEIETVGATREKVAKAIQTVVGGTVKHVGTPDAYDPWTVLDSSGRLWNVVADASLSTVSFNYRAEIVSPILCYSDIEDLQEIIRAVRKAGAKTDHTTSIHLHIDASKFDHNAVIRLMKIMYKNEDLLIKALNVREDRLAKYTKRMEPAFIQKLERRRPRSMRELNTLWYGQYTPHPQRYHGSRYHGINLNSLFVRGTIEIRFFNGDLHAGRVKAAIQLCLAVAAKAINTRCASSKRREVTGSDKYAFRVWLLNLGLIGDEFKTARKHLLANLTGDIAFKNGRPKKDKKTGENKNEAA